MLRRSVCQSVRGGHKSSVALRCQSVKGEEARRELNATTTATTSTGRGGTSRSGGRKRARSFSLKINAIARQRERERGREAPNCYGKVEDGDARGTSRSQSVDCSFFKATRRDEHFEFWWQMYAHLNKQQQRRPLQGDLTGCRTGDGEKLSSSQAEPGQTIKSAVA